MSRVTYTFNSVDRTNGSNARYYVLLPLDLDIIGVVIESIRIPYKFYNIKPFETRAIFTLGFRDRYVEFKENMTAAEFITRLSASTAGEGKVSLESHTNDDQTTAYRLKVESLFPDTRLIVDYTKHPLARALGLEEINIANPPAYVFKIPMEDTTYTVSGGNCRILISRKNITGDIITVQYSITPGQYTPEQLAYAFQSAINNDYEASITYNANTKKFNFSFGSAALLYGFGIKANPALGFVTDYFVDLAETIGPIIVSSTSRVNLDFTNFVHVKSVQLFKGQKNKHYIYPGIRNVIASVPIDEIKNPNPVDTEPKTIITYETPQRIPYLDLTIVDDIGETIDLIGHNWSITLTFITSNKPPI